jgi:hypothetical protein
MDFSYVFTDNDYIRRYGLDISAAPHLTNHIVSSIEKTKAIVTSAGMVYVLTPAPDRNRDSVESELLAQGFEKTSAEEIDVLIKKDKKSRADYICAGSYTFFISMAAW